MKDALDPRTFAIANVLLFAAFANFSSIGIQIGGIGALAPGRRQRPWPSSAFAPCWPVPWRIYYRRRL